MVRHRDLAWKPGRRSDPRGVDWDWLQEQISTTPNPLAGSSVGGASGPFSAPQLVADFYNVHGGLLTFGYATNNAYEAPDSSGEVCVYLPVEFGLIKYKPSAPAGWNVRLAPIAEVIAAQGGTHP